MGCATVEQLYTILMQITFSQKLYKSLNNPTYRRQRSFFHEDAKPDKKDTGLDNCWLKVKPNANHTP